jgi:hypothetical protein
VDTFAIAFEDLDEGFVDTRLFVIQEHKQVLQGFIGTHGSKNLQGLVADLDVIGFEGT